MTPETEDALRTYSTMRYVGLRLSDVQGLVDLAEKLEAFSDNPESLIESMTDKMEADEEARWREEHADEIQAREERWKQWNKEARERRARQKSESEAKQKELEKLIEAEERSMVTFSGPLGEFLEEWDERASVIIQGTLSNRSPGHLQDVLYRNFQEAKGAFKLRLKDFTEQAGLPSSAFYHYTHALKVANLLRSRRTPGGGPNTYELFLPTDDPTSLMRYTEDN